MKLSISIDMGAKNNGVFIAKSKDGEILDKRATTVIVNEKAINFSKKSRRENRHRVRNIKRRKLAKRLLWEILEEKKEFFFNKKLENSDIESINGLLNNRGFDRSEGGFEKLDEITLSFLKKYAKGLDIETLKNIESFDNWVNGFDDNSKLLDELEKIKAIIEKLLKDIELYKKKKDILKDLEALKKRKIPKKFKQFSYIKNIYNSLDKPLKYAVKEADKTKEDILTNLKQGKFEEVIKEQELYLEDEIIDKHIEEINSLDFSNLTEDDFEIIEKDLKQYSGNDPQKKEDDVSLAKTISTLIEAINTGAKPRAMYIKEIKDEIKKFNFIENKEEFHKLVANISNLQLRALRKYFHKKNNKSFDERKLSIVLYRYFISRHYKKDFEKARQEELFKVLDEKIKLSKKNEKKLQDYTKYDDSKSQYKVFEFLTTCNPKLTIPPFEDMNNRNTYKCNVLHINPGKITDTLLRYIKLLIKKEPFNSDDFTKVPKYIEDKDGNITIEWIEPKDKNDFAQILQRILDSTKLKGYEKIYPRDVFKHKKNGADFNFYKNISKEYYEEFKDFAQKYYEHEEKAINGIYDDNVEFFIKCNKNTPSKRNFKEVSINAIFKSNFSKDELDDNKQNSLQSKIKKSQEKIGKKRLFGYIEFIVELYKEYQNEFFKNVEYANYLNKKDKLKENENIDSNIKDIIEHKEELLNKFKNIFEELNKKSFFSTNFDINEAKSLVRFINAIIQSYNILFTDIKGHYKTCKLCTIENNKRSYEDNVIAKRLLSDVAKPINGKVEMLLDRIAWEVVQEIDDNLLNGVKEIEIILEQNRFAFEKSLRELKIRKKEPKEQNKKDICPYTGKEFEKSKGEYDHIIPQSSSKKRNKQVYNSEANLILCSREGNEQKGAKIAVFNYIQRGTKAFDKLVKIFDANRASNQIEISKQHLQSVFGANKTKEEIKKEIEEIWRKGQWWQNYTNFKNLKPDEQRAFRYMLIMPESQYYQEAIKLLETENKTTTNGTQKRFAKLIYSKLPNGFENRVDVKVIQSDIVSATRNDFAIKEFDSKTGEIKSYYENISKEHIVKNNKAQTTFSHILDALTAYCVANSVDKDEFLKMANELENKQKIKEIKTKYWHETDNKNYNIASKKIFDEKDIGVGYIHILVENDSRGKNKFKKGVVKDSFKDFSLKEKDFCYLKEKGILKKFKEDVNKSYFKVDKQKLNQILFDKKQEVLQNINTYKKIEELRYTYTRVDPFEFIEKFLDGSNEEKKAVKKIIAKERPSLDDITFDNLMAWFSRSGKLDKKGAKLGYYKSWEIFATIIANNKEELFKETTKTTKKGETYKLLLFDKEKALELCLKPQKPYKKALFDIKSSKYNPNYKYNRTKKKKDYTLYSASKNDTQYIHRRKDNKGNYIYQTRIANSQYPSKHFYKSKLFKMKNIIPLTIKNYEKAFGYLLDEAHNSK